MNPKTKGFTLIELLVVIAIIGLLSTIVLASLNGARKKSRDARRLADFKAIQTALELYYNDNNSYPPIPGSCGSASDAWSSWGCWSSIIPNSYMPRTPVDPLNVDVGNCYTVPNCHIYHYCIVNGGQTYQLTVDLETAGNKSLLPPPYCGDGGPNTYWVTP